MKKRLLFFPLLLLLLASLVLPVFAAPLSPEMESDPASTGPETTQEGDPDPDEEEPVTPRIQIFDPQYGYPVEDGYAVEGKAALLCDLNSDTILYKERSAAYRSSFVA